MIKRLLILIIILVLNTFGFSQSRLTYSIDVEPIYSYRNYTLKDYKAYPDFSESELISYFNNYYDSIESPKIGWGLSLGIGYELNNKIQLKSGLNYKNIGEKTEYLYVIGAYIIDGEQIYLYKSPPEKYYIKNIYSYISLPINLQYNIYNHNKLSCSFIIGSDFDFLIKSFISKHQNRGYNDAKYEYGNASSVTCNIHSGIEFSYSINDKLSFYIQPEYAHYITPNVTYNISLPDVPYYYNFNQYNYYCQIKFGIKFKR